MFVVRKKSFFFEKGNISLYLKIIIHKYRYDFVVKQKSEVKNVLKEIGTYTCIEVRTFCSRVIEYGGEFDNEEIRKIL